ncbi:GH25 family lysozyme [Limosilactobacillus reuteri]|uniref:Gametolysin n=1 Tax=Limosilactobacillus reuteri TaxID=1598 RepID=A0A256SUL0_LIMRT|nr:GH25 family lysozyme [Limosilactobacillus reuteri]OYS70356.1 gametolysin [Limosilactobacillus reuteri]
MTRSYVIDVSAYQPQATYYTFWEKWKARGVRGAIIKLSESTYWRNQYGAGQIAAAKHVGFKVSGYHFSRFIGDGNRARLEANTAIATANTMGLEHGSALVLDYEERAGYQSANTLAAIIFCNAVKQAGFIPVFYSYSGMRDLWDYEAIYKATGAKLWIASYPTMAGVTQPDYEYFPAISTHTDAWQFSSNAWGEQIDISVDFTGVFTMEEKVTSGGNLDSVRFDGNKLVVNGWFAAAQAQGKPYAFAILTNEQGSQEFGRAQVNITSRPDVPKVYPDIPNGANSGFSASFDYSNQIKGKKLHLIFRYTDDAAGNGNFVDYVSLLDLTKSAANLDNVDTVVFSNKLQVSGWFATDMSLGLNHRFLILYDSAAQHELQRIEYNPTSRGDVQQAHPDIFASELSGFSGEFNYDANLVGRKLQIVARYSDDDSGEGHRVDYWFDPFNGPAMPVLDGKSETEVLVHEFSASKADNDLISLKFK